MSDRRKHIRDELEFHLEMRARELRAEGLSEDEAGRRARELFGDPRQVEQESLDAYRSATRTRRWRMKLTESIWQDIHYAWRGFARTPTFTVIVILTLALGIGATTTIFSVVDGVVLKPLALKDPDRLVILGTRFHQTEGAREDSPLRQMSSWRLSSTSGPNFHDWREQTTSFESMGGAMLSSRVLTGHGEPSELGVARISDEFLETLGVGPVLGRLFSDEEYRIGEPEVALIGWGLWQSLGGGDPDFIGTTIQGAGHPFTVIGVMPRGWRPPEALWLREPDLWMPVDFHSAEFESRGRRIMRVAARLKPGVSIGVAREELEVLADALIDEYPDQLTYRGNESRIGIGSMHEETVGSMGSRLYLLLGAVSLLLLISCTNVASLFLARGTDRARELALRSALGAGRGRLARQLLTECVLISIVGGMAGIALAYFGVEAFLAWGPRGIPRAAEIGVDWRVLLFVLGISILCGLLFGLAPAIASRTEALSSAIREGVTNVTAGRRRLRIRGALVVAESALAILLLVGAGLLFHSFLRLVSVDPGFDPKGVLTMPVRLPETYKAEEKRALFVEDLLTRARGIPGILTVAAIVNPPIGDTFWRGPLQRDGEPLPENQQPSSNFHFLTPGYFGVVGIRILEGRDFTDRDRAGAEEVVIVNQTLAGKLWPGEDPVGHRLRGLAPSRIVSRLGDGPSWATVVGMVSDIRQHGLNQEPMPEAYFPYAQKAWIPYFNVIARYEGDAAALARPLRQTVWDVEPGIPLQVVQTLEERIAGSVGRQRFLTAVLATFATVALFLAAAGIYGTLLYSVGRRTREMGIRMALGAGRGRVVRMVLKSGLSLVVSGIALGLTVAWFVSGVLSEAVFAISTTDPMTYTLAALLLAAVGAAASYLPARRTTRVDPVETLRAE